MSPQCPWKRWPFENDSAWGVFCEWLHSVDADGIRPSIDEFAARKDERSQVLRWSEENVWEGRAAEFDMWVKTQKVYKVMPLVHPILQSIYRMALAELRKYEDAYTRSGPAPGFFDFKTLMQMLKFCLDVAKTLAKLESKEKDRIANAGEGEEILDFTKLTLEEHRLWETLQSKARVSR